MKRILLTAAGGPSTMSFVRSLRDADEDYYIVGTDCMKYNLFRSEADKTYLCPRATHEKYIPFIKHLIEKEQIEYMHTQPEIEVFEIGKHRDEIPCRLFMPDQETIELCRDKFASWEYWKSRWIKVPESMTINDTEDLNLVIDKWYPEIWIREITGAGGKGSLSRPSPEQAFHHIETCNGWGSFMAAEHLTDKSITWQSIWNEGRLVVAQGRKRLYWEFSNRAQSGVTGLTGTGVTVSDPELDELAIRCIKAIDPEPHGIFSVDFTFDWDGVPNPTEINIGKFFTTHHFITRAGCNMPEMLVKLAFGEYDGEYDIRNPCEPNMYWIRGIDVLPKLVTSDEIHEVEKAYAENLEAIRETDKCPSH